MKINDLNKGNKSRAPVPLCDQIVFVLFFQSTERFENKEVFLFKTQNLWINGIETIWKQKALIGP